MVVAPGVPEPAALDLDAQDVRLARHLEAEDMRAGEALGELGQAGERAAGEGGRHGALDGVAPVGGEEGLEFGEGHAGVSVAGAKGG